MTDRPLGLRRPALLLGPLMEAWPDLFRQEVLNKWCDPTVGRCKFQPLRPVVRVQGFSAEAKIRYIASKWWVFNFSLRPYVTDRAVVAQVGKGFMAAVKAVTSAETPRAGRSRQLPLKVVRCRLTLSNPR
jgi:hypothetical protein